MHKTPHSRLLPPNTPTNQPKKVLTDMRCKSQDIMISDYCQCNQANQAKIRASKTM